MNKIRKFLSSIVVIGAALSVTSCNDFLDVEPTSSIIPENYLNEESQLGAYAIALYADLFESHDSWSYGIYQDDGGTDNGAEREYGNNFGNKTVIGEWKTTTDDTSNWEFDDMYAANYFLDNVLPLYEAGEITGTQENIDHYVGEMYFIRAYGYYAKLKLLGDFPIITTTLDTDWDVLVAASERAPRNEVARFILEDLDKAIDLLLETAPDGNKNRISKYVAQLFKSRVALYEASWLRNFKGTAFVPGGDGWPGASYHTDFSYVAGSIDAEVEYFLGQAITSAAAVADAVALTENTQNTPDADNDYNPYFQMFGEVDLYPYSEILMWREYNIGLGVTHNMNSEVTKGNYGFGLTHAQVMSFLDKNGLPYYDSNALFTAADDDDIFKVRGEDGNGGFNRDNRIFLFLKVPGQTNIWINEDSGTHKNITEASAPVIYETLSNGRYTTGYGSRKGNNPDGALCDNGYGYGGCPTFRVSEAYLNYIEAYYMLNSSLDSKATTYWNALRTRAGIGGSIDATIAALDIAKESVYDWGAYTAGALIQDKTMMAIRKERRSEFVSENFRIDDLHRWRSFEQLIDEPWDVLGMKFWNSPNYDLYSDAEKALFVYDPDNTSSNMSAKEYGDYVNVYKINNKSLAFDGLTWQMAHYLSPIGIRHMTLTGDDTPIYQNPYWSTSAGVAALQ